MADVVACIALVISLASVGWQVVTFVGLGSRVKARLKLGLYDPEMTMAIVLPLTGTAFAESKSVIDQGYSTRCLVVEVSNIGRIGVDVIRCRAKATNGAILDPLSSVPANPKPNTGASNPGKRRSGTSPFLPCRTSSTLPTPVEFQTHLRYKVRGVSLNSAQSERFERRMSGNSL